MATGVRDYILLLSVCACSSFSSINSSSDGPVVHTNAGTVLGRQLTVSGRLVDAFYGIPYAEPPVRQLRFRKPVPVNPWKGVYSATEKPPPCWQFDLRYTSKITVHYLNRSISSEDCLYLNVWRPAAACPGSARCDARLPVVVFLYGGAFQWGDSALLIYDPANFVAHSDVIYVTLNYRLGIFGFLSSGTKHQPGNAGLWDQNLALKWVRSNIGSFGGNRDDITLSGFSAGAISAGLHAISPQSRNLFHRLVLQSCSPLSLILSIALSGTGKFFNVAGTFDCFQDTGDLSKDVPEIIACLQEVDAQDIYTTLKDGDQVNQLFSPIWGDEFLPNDIFSAETWNSLRIKEILLGSNPDEGSFFLDYLKFEVPGLMRVVTIDIRVAATLAISTVLGAPMSAAKEIVAAYFGENHVEHDDTSLDKILVKLLGDIIVDCPTNLFAEVASEQGISVYRYLFSHRPSFSLWPVSYGITHMDDLAFNLGYLPFLNDTSRYTSPLGDSARNTLRAMSPTLDEISFMKELVGTWTTFFKTGKPLTPSSKVEWPRYSVKTPECIYLQPHNYTQGVAPRLHVCDLWRPFLLKRKPVIPEVTARTPNWTKKPTLQSKGSGQKGTNTATRPLATTYFTAVFIITTLLIVIK